MTQDADQKHLVMIKGSKALHIAMDAGFGGEQSVQRCRNHKLDRTSAATPEELNDHPGSAPALAGSQHGSLAYYAH